MKNGGTRENPINPANMALVQAEYDDNLKLRFSSFNAKEYDKMFFVGLHCERIWNPYYGKNFSTDELIPSFMATPEMTRALECAQAELDERELDFGKLQQFKDKAQLAVLHLFCKYLCLVGRESKQVKIFYDNFRRNYKRQTKIWSSVENKMNVICFEFNDTSTWLDTTCFLNQRVPNSTSWRTYCLALFLVLAFHINRVLFYDGAGWGSSSKDKSNLRTFRKLEKDTADLMLLVFRKSSSGHRMRTKSMEPVHVSAHTNQSDAPTTQLSFAAKFGVKESMQLMILGQRVTVTLKDHPQGSLFATTTAYHHFVTATSSGVIQDSCKDFKDNPAKQRMLMDLYYNLGRAPHKWTSVMKALSRKETEVDELIKKLAAANADQTTALFQLKARTIPLLKTDRHALNRKNKAKVKKRKASSSDDSPS